MIVKKLEVGIVVDKIVLLENNKKYVILDGKHLNNKYYYFALRLDDNEETTNTYLFFEEIKDNAQGIIRITLKYDEKGARVIDGLKRISKPGLKVYAGKEELPKVLNGLGIAIISTSKGLMTDKEARSAGVGGEVLAYIW